MSQVSYGTITVSDITDITDVYLEYGLALDNANVDNNYAFDQLGERGWSTDYPNWQSGYQVWIREVTQKEGLLPEPGTPYLDKAVNQINNNFINLDNRLRNFFYPGDPSYSGAFAVSKSTADGLDVTDANTYGFNTRMGVLSISMGYNKIPLLEMGILDEGNFNGIKLYSPVINHNAISGNRLDVTLTSEGLKLLKGGIEAGTYSSTTTDFIYLSTIDYNNTPTVNIGGNTSGWRQIIGSKFGVKNDGTLYAAGAHVDGDIIAQSLTISNGANTYDAINAINSSTYAIAITNDPSNTSIVDPSTTTYLYPILYHSGVRIEPYVLSQDTAIISGKKYYSRSGNTYTEISNPTGNPSENGYYEIDYTHFIWYQDDDTIGTVGSATDGGIVASYGHTYRVIFNLSDEEVGVVQTVQQIMVDPSKYITRISSDGITVHPEVQDSGSNYIHIDSNGFKIKNQISGIPAVNTDMVLAGFTVDGTQIGQTGKSHLEMDYHSMQLIDKESDTYFYVSDLRDNSGLATWTETCNYYNYTTYGSCQLSLEADELISVIDVETGIDWVSSSEIHPGSGGGAPISKIGSIVRITSTDRPSNNTTINVTYKSSDQYTKAYTLGVRTPNEIIGPMSVCEGDNTIASGICSHAEGIQTIAKNYAHAEGARTSAGGFFSHAEGLITHADAWCAHAEGESTTAGNDAHAEGHSTKASGNSSHAEGFVTEASGNSSHAEGYYTEASGQYSHTQNYGTIASKSNQTAIGKYNIEDTATVVANQKALIIGNGTSSQRSNALTVDWEGNVDVDSRGSYSVGGTNILELVYPVGSIYMSVNATDPGTLFGGTWTRLTDTFLLAAGSTYTADDGTHTTATGGAATVTLTADQTGVHQHTHSFTQPTVNGGAVTSGITGGAHSHYLNYFSKTVAKGAAYDRPAGTTSSGTANGYTTNSPTHTHNLPAHTHSVSGGAVGNTTAANATKAHNNMPPYLVVYMWKRTA